MLIPLFIQKETEGQADEGTLPKMSNLTEQVATVIKKESCLLG